MLARRARASKGHHHGCVGVGRRFGPRRDPVPVRPVGDIDIGELRADLIAIGPRRGPPKKCSAGPCVCHIGHTATVDPDFARYRRTSGAPVIITTRKAITAAVERGETNPSALEQIHCRRPALAGAGAPDVRRPRTVRRRDAVDTIVLPALRNACDPLRPGAERRGRDVAATIENPG